MRCFKPFKRCLPHRRNAGGGRVFPKTLQMHLTASNTQDFASMLLLVKMSMASALVLQREWPACCCPEQDYYLGDCASAPGPLLPHSTLP